MFPRKKSPDANPTPPTPSQVPHDLIAVRAYEFFVQRGYSHGADLQDWFQAESELLAGQPAEIIQPAKTVRRRKTQASKAAVS